MMEPALETMSMDEIMRAWPQTIRIILRHRMPCVGCPMAPFQLIADACRENDVNEAALLEDLRRAIATKESD